jgi:hypothetical protein
VRLQIMFFRAAAVGKTIAAEDKVEEAVTRDDRRTRLIPFGAMISIGLVTLIAIAAYGRTHDRRDAEPKHEHAAPVNTDRGAP